MPSHLPHAQDQSDELRLMVTAFAAFVAPTKLSEPLARADYERSIQTNEQLRLDPPEKRLEHIERIRTGTESRIRLLRRRLATSLLSMGSAATLALIFHLAPVVKVSASSLGIGSTLCFAVATLGRLGWAGQTVSGNTAPERLDNRIMHVMYWAGMYLATAALL